MSDKNFKVKNGIDAAGKLTITNTSGTVSLIEVNGAGGGQFTVTPYGGISTNAGLQSIGGPSYFGGYGGTTSIVVNVTGASGQTGDLQRWTTFDGTILAKVDSNGSISATDLTLSGNLTVNGTTTNLNSTNLIIEDKNIIIADVTTPTDTTADGAGITIKGATNKTFNWVESTGSFTSSEPLIINTNSTTRANLILKPITSQTANLQEWQNSSGTALSYITKDGTLDLRNTSATAFTNSNSGNVGPKIDLWGGQYGIGIAVGRISFFTPASGGIALKQDSYSGTSVFDVAYNGATSIGLQSASAIGLVIKAAASQTANLTEWKDSSNTVLTKIDNNAGFYAQYIEAKNTAGILSSGESQIKIASPDGLKDIRFWNRNDAGGLYYYNSSGGSKNILRIAHSTDPRVVTQTWQDFTSGNSANYGGRVNIDTSTTTAIGMVIRGVDSQTANLQEWQSSDGTVLSTIGPNGTVTLKSIGSANIATFTNGTNGYGAGYINYAGTFNINSANMGFPYTSSGAVLAVNATYAGSLPLSVRGYASQTADLQQWQNNAGTTLSKVDASGNITAPSYNLSDSKYLLRKTIKKTVDPAGNAVANNTYDLFDMNFPLSLQGTFYIQASIRGPGYGQNLTYSLPATYVMDWINQYPITNPFTNSTTWVDLTPLTFSPRHLMTNDYFKFQAKVNANQISFRIKLTGTLTGAPVFDIYIQHSEEFANSTITELNTTGTDATTSNVMPNSLSSKAGLSAIFNPITLYSNSASNTPLTIKGFASQTADILQIQDSSGTTRVSFERGGALSVQPSTALNGYAGFFKSPSSVVVGLMVRGASSQTANLQEWQNSSGTALAKIDATGALNLNVATSSTLTTPIVLENSATGTGTGTQVVFRYGGGDYASISSIYSGTPAGPDMVFNVGGLGVQRMRIDNNGTVTINGFSAAAQGLIVKGAASQTANLTEWHNSSGTLMAAVKADGSFRAGGANGATKFLVDQYGTLSLGTDRNNTGTPTYLFVQSQLTTDIGAVIKGASSQTANLQEWQNSSGTVLTSVDKDGYLQTPRLVITNGGNIIDSAGTTPYFGFGSNQIAIYARNAGYKPLIIQGAASQTANLQEWQNSSGTVENAIIPGKGLLFNLGNDGNGSQNLTQIAFGYSPISSSTGNWKHWVITKHNNAATVNNAIEFYTNDGTQSGVYPTNAIFGLSVTNGGIITPKENINIASASTVGLTVKGASSQASDLQQWQNSSGTVLAKVDANGNFSAISKSFDIPHPTKENMRLRYASLEGPENGVYIRGTLESNIIELPEYWTGLVHEDSITVSLTAVGFAQNIYVEKIEDNKVYIGGELTKAFFTVYGERKDIDKLTVEY